MKTYRTIKEDIGLSTGVGLANIDLPLGNPPLKRRYNGYNNDVSLAHNIKKNVFEALGICEDCMEAMVFKDGKLTCRKCKKSR
jgi:hypothetical protein